MSHFTYPNMGDIPDFSISGSHLERGGFRVAVEGLEVKERCLTARGPAIVPRVVAPVPTS
jgi:hypothetical protein